MARRPDQHRSDAWPSAKQWRTTFTHELLRGSPAIDAGDPNFTPPPSYDQRGPDFLRVRNGRIDVGSFEVQAGSGQLQRQHPQRQLQQRYGNADADSYLRQATATLTIDTETFTDAETGANAQAASYAATAPVTFIYEKETHCPIRFR